MKINMIYIIHHLEIMQVLMLIRIQLQIYIRRMYKRLGQEIITLEQKQRKIYITQGSNLSNSVSLC